MAVKTKFKNKQVLQTVIVYHPRRPYKVKGYQLPELDDFVVVGLTDRYYRVIHTPSGLTMADTEDIATAFEFLNAMVAVEEADDDTRHAFLILSWDDFRKHMKGDVHLPYIQTVIDVVTRYTKRIGYVDSTVTADCRYKYPPEYLT